MDLIMQEVERTGQVFAEAREALRMACVRAVARGASEGEVAAVGGVDLDTVHSWVLDQGRTSDRSQEEAQRPAPQTRPKEWVDYPGASA